MDPAGAPGRGGSVGRVSRFLLVPPSGWDGELKGMMVVVGGGCVWGVLGETHGYCVLQRFAAQGCDACPSPGVTVRGATQLGGPGHVGGARQGRRHHPGERGLVEVRLETGAVRRHVGQTHGVRRGAGAEAALRQGLGHGLLAAQGGGQLQLGHAGHPRRGPAGVVGVEGAEAVAHGRGGRRRGRELRQAVVGGQQGPRSSEHVGGLLAFLPLGPTVLEPDLKEKRALRDQNTTAVTTLTELS